jgi:putative DNA primase/helicase
MFQDSVKFKFDVNGAIDKIGDLPRIIKIWGTLNVKSAIGIDTDERYFRIAHIHNKKDYRDEDMYLKESILNLKQDKQIEFDIEDIDKIDIDNLPPCINQLIKFYENKDGNHWMRIIQFMASFFMSIGLPIRETKDTILRWNKKQPYHESGEEEDIERTVERIYKNKINCPNCEKIKKEKGGFPFFGLSELKLCRNDSKCNKCINPVIRYKRGIDTDSGRISDATNVFTDKRELAKQFLKIQPLFYDKGKLWWIWISNKYKWEIIDETDVLNAIEKSSRTDTIDSKERNEILEALRQEGRKNVPEDIKPSWIQFQDQIIDLSNGERFEASPKYFVTNPIPHKISGNPDTPNMDRIFEEWVGKNHVKTLYEILAYCCLCDYPINRLFCFIGSGMNGKSCFLNLLKEFIGTTNVCSTELDFLLTSRFEITKLHKKLVCMMGETNFNEIRNTSVLKRLTGGDLIGFEYKNKNPFEDKNYAKIIIATNNLPTTDDKTMGFYRRWMIIDFINQFTEKKDILKDIPLEEYENLATKCTLILTDILSIREFTNEGSVEDRMKKFEEKSNPIGRFIKERCTIDDPNDFITSSQFEKQLNGWCKENKYREFSSETIAKKLKDFGLEKGNSYIDWYEDGTLSKKKARVWFGIKWKT